MLHVDAHVLWCVLGCGVLPIRTEERERHMVLPLHSVGVQEKVKGARELSSRSRTPPLPSTHRNFREKNVYPKIVPNPSADLSLLFPDNCSTIYFGGIVVVCSSGQNSPNLYAGEVQRGHFRTLTGRA